MRPSLIALLPAALLAGCAGYAIDYAKPKTSIIQPALARYALDARQSQCVSDTLTKTLTVWQLRQLQIVAPAKTLLGMKLRQAVFTTADPRPLFSSLAPVSAASRNHYI